MVEDVQIVALKDVVKMTSLSRTAINKFRIAGRFPTPISLGEKRIGFVKSEVIAWIEARVAERNAKAA